MFKKILVFLFFLLLPLSIQAANDPDVYFFYSDSCPHCHKEALFLDKLEDEYEDTVIIKRLEVSNHDNVQLMFSLASQLNTSVSGVPFTVIGDRYFIGYYNDEVTGEEIRQAIDKKINSLTNNIIVPIEPPKQPGVNEEISNTNDVEKIDNTLDKKEKNDTEQVEDNMVVPFVGSINPKDFSLPILSVVLGFLDGFNPCAMWALIFLISLLLGMKDRRRMWILGVTFIVSSALVYFLFMAAWLNIFLFLGLVLWIRIIIGLLALGGGSYNIREFFRNKAGTCKLDGQKEKERIFDRLKKITEQKSFVIAFVGIILLAFAVNMVELICSAGLPAVYTHILSLNDLSTVQYYAYIGLYILFFMLDDLFVFFAAMVTMHLVGLSTKYSRYSSLMGGILMVIIGLLLLFRYDLLTFA